MATLFLNEKEVEIKESTDVRVVLHSKGWKDPYARRLRPNAWLARVRPNPHSKYGADRAFIELDTDDLSRKGRGEIEVASLPPGFYEAFSSYTRSIEHRVVFEITQERDIRLLAGIEDISPSPKNNAEPTESPTIEIVEWGGPARATRAIGQVFRDNGHGPVKVVTQTPEWTDDPGSFGYPHEQDGYLVTLGCVPATPEESAALEAEEAERRRLQDEKRKASDEKAAATAQSLENYKQAHAKRTAGLQSTTAPPPNFTPASGVTLAKHRERGYRAALIKHSELRDKYPELLIEDVQLDDDFQRYFWGFPKNVHQWRLSRAAKMGITPDKAREYLDRYSGTHGSDIYEAVLRDSDD